MILSELHADVDEFALRTGWNVRPEGLCRGEVCVPAVGALVDGKVDVTVVSERLGMALVHDEDPRVWSLGPAAGGRALTSAVAPDLTLPDWHGEDFSLSSLRGRKVIMVAWASW